MLELKVYCSSSSLSIVSLDLRVAWADAMPCLLKYSWALRLPSLFHKSISFSEGRHRDLPVDLVELSLDINKIIKNMIRPEDNDKIRYSTTCSHIIKQEVLNAIWIISVDLDSELDFFGGEALAQKILKPVRSLNLRIFLHLL